MVPGAQHQKYFVVVCVLWLYRLIDRDVAVDVLLIPKAMHEHHRHFERLSREKLIHSLVAPVCIVAWMLQNLSPETDLFESAAPAQLARRPRLHEHIVVIEMAGPPLDF